MANLNAVCLDIIARQEIHGTSLNWFIVEPVCVRLARTGRQLTYTNTIEGFWSLVKRAWYSTHHHYSVKYMPLLSGGGLL